MYKFFTRGYSPYFIPVVANFGRTHHDQRSQRLSNVEKPGQAAYFKAVKEYGRSIIGGGTVHQFRNGSSQVVGQITPNERASLRKNIWRHRLLRSRLFRVDPYTLASKLKARIVS
jgi:hypothetical protein